MAWSQEQIRNAQVIYQVGVQLGASLRDVQIAIMAAIVESGLRNLNYGDADSIGMFQQRDAWGSTADRLDPYKSAKMFFLGGAAGQRGLLDFADRDSMGMGEAAQAVQVSAFPDRYAEHQTEAAGLLGQVSDGEALPAQEGTLGMIPSNVTVTSTEPLDMSGLLTGGALAAPPSVTEVNGVGEVTADEAGIGELKFDMNGATTSTMLDTPKFGQPTNDPMDSLKMPSLEDLGIDTSQLATTTATDMPSGASGGLIDYAKDFLGTPYVWGGTTPTGFDCSGFVQYVYKKFGVSLPRISADQARSGARVALDALKPGDLVAWDNSSRNVGADHIAIYIGNGMIIEAPRPGSSVQLSSIYDQGNAWGVRVL